VLGVPASELVDLTIGADELWGAAAIELAERVAEAATTAEAIVVLEQVLFARQAAPTDPVVAEVADRLLPGHTDDVAALSSELFISARQLRRRVVAGIGLAPKVATGCCASRGSWRSPTAAKAAPPSWRGSPPRPATRISRI
jgi:hypothetical protein